MTKHNGSGLTLEYQPNGKGSAATITARLGDSVLACERFDLGKLKAREAFAEAVCKGRPGIDKAAIEAELLNLAAEVTARPKKDAAESPGKPVDVSRLVRPELFHLPEVSGLAVPVMMLRQTEDGEKVVGEWILYLRWHATGKREAVRLPDQLPPKDKHGRPVWFWPSPGQPTPATKAGWAASARERWLKGEPAKNPAEVFARLCERIAYFIDLPQRHAPGVTATLALWTILTHTYPLFPAVPYLYVGGPLSSGKSRVFEILDRVVFRPLVSSNMTGPAMFRTLHTSGGTLLLDEAERLRDVRDPGVAELLSMLLAGYKRGGAATRLEPVGDSGFRTVSFDVYSPKALACIAGLPPALASRCIAVTMFRAGPGSPKPKRRIDGDLAGWERLRDDLHTLTLESGPILLTLANRADVVPDGLGGRDFELWQPLLALASWIEGAGARGLVALLSEHALATAEAGRDDQTPDFDETLLRLLAEAVRLGERPEPGELLKRAQEAEPTGFKTWTARAVTAHLKRYGIPTPKKSMGRRVFRDVTVDHLRQIQESYGIDLDLPEPVTVLDEKEAPE